MNYLMFLWMQEDESERPETKQHIRKQIKNINFKAYAKVFLLDW